MASLCRNFVPAVLQTIDQLRLFIALPTPEAIKDALAKAQSELRRAVPNGEIRWTRPEQFHLTLRFLGNVSDSKVEELKLVIQAACGQFAPLKLTAAGIGFFPPKRAPRVIWAGVAEPGGHLVSLWKAVDLATQPFSPEKGEEHFAAHITLARVNRLGRKEADALMKESERFERTIFGEWTVRQVELMRSELSSQGARHSLLAALPLGGG